MRRVLDQDYLREKFPRYLPVAAAVASICFDALSLWLALHKNFIVAMVGSISSALLITLAVYWWIQWRGIRTRNEFFTEIKREEYYNFISARKVDYIRRITILIKQEITSIPFLLTYGHGREYNFQVSEEKNGQTENVRWHILKQRIAGRPAIMLSREKPLQSKEECTLVIRSELIDAFPDCKSEGFTVRLPPRLRKFRIQVRMPKKYFRGSPPVIRWFKLHMGDVVHPLGEGRIEGVERGEHVNFIADLSNFLNVNWYTTFAFSWDWHIPENECVEQIIH